MPGWYGMASVKWLNRIEALAKPYEGFQQVVGYHYRSVPGGPRTPVTHMRVKSLLVPPGIPDWYSRQRLVDAGPASCSAAPGRAAACRSRSVEVGIDGALAATAELDPPQGKFAWRGWRYHVEARAGRARAWPAGRPTPTARRSRCEPRWDAGGFGNNAVQRVRVTVR